MCAAPRGGCHQPHTSAAAGDGEGEGMDGEKVIEKILLLLLLLLLSVSFWKDLQGGSAALEMVEGGKCFYKGVKENQQLGGQISWRKRQITEHDEGEVYRIVLIVVQQSA